MNNSIKSNLKDGKHWLRLIYMLLFAGILQLAMLLLSAVVILQFAFSLVTGQYNDRLRQFGSALSTFMYQVFRFLVYQTDDKPFPFDDWPAAEASSDIIDSVADNHDKYTTTNHESFRQESFRQESFNQESFNQESFNQKATVPESSGAESSNTELSSAEFDKPEFDKPEFEKPEFEKKEFRNADSSGSELSKPKSSDLDIRASSRDSVDESNPEGNAPGDGDDVKDEDKNKHEKPTADKDDESSGSDAAHSTHNKNKH